MANKSFGRMVAEDPKDKRFLIAAAVPQELTRISRYWNSSGWWGYQGNKPQCVGFSWAHWVEDGPVTHTGQAPIADPEDIYKNAQILDEWEGEDYDGTSVRAGAKYLKDQGFITEYRWGWDLQSLVTAVLNAGPVVVGTYWYENMLETDEKFFVHAEGQIVGGHAYLINGVNTKLKRFRLKNSWGRWWGNKGHAFISFDDMERLIRDQGEVCLAIEK